MKITTKKIEFKNRLDLECGQSLPSFELMVETYGELNQNKNNAILVLAWNFFSEIKKNNSNLSENFYNIKELELNN